MRTTLLFLMLILVSSVQSCKQDELINPPFDDDQILHLVYSSYKCPVGFYTEDLLKASLYYENTISIQPNQNRGTTWYELSTDNYDQARTWSDFSNANSSVSRQIVSERETDQYFEFSRRDLSDWTLLSRVHKSTYLDRSMFDRLNPGPTLGVFKKRPLTLGDVQKLVEYLWFIENRETGGAKVLSLVSSETFGVFRISLIETQVVYGDFGLHDQITVYESVYSIDRADGSITLKRSVQRTIAGHLN